MICQMEFIGNTAEKSLPDTLPNLYHGEKDAYQAKGMLDKPKLLLYIKAVRGRVKQKVKITNIFHPSVTASEYGWCFPEVGDPKHRWDVPNINRLTDNDPKRYDYVMGGLIAIPGMYRFQVQLIETLPNHLKGGVRCHFQNRLIWMER